MKEQIPKEIKLKKGESAIITLKGLATAGYQWNYTIENSTNCITISKEFAPLKKSVDKNAGANADEVFTITAVEKGNAVVFFYQKRTWEKDVDPVYEKKVNVVIE